MPRPAEPLPTRGAILLALKQGDGFGVQPLADSLGITPVAVRKHLDSLIREGLVRVDAIKQQRGRPVLRYRLTAAADELFPQGYRQLAVELIDDLVAAGGEPALERLLESRNSRLRREHFDGVSLDNPRDRLAVLVRLRNADGYMATVEEQTDSFVIREHHCPIYDVATRHAAACRCEESLFRDVMQQPVVREESIVDGDASCTYRVLKA